MILQPLNTTQEQNCFEELPGSRNPETARQFLFSLQKVAPPFLEWANASLGYFSEKNEIIYVTGAECLCHIIENRKNNPHQHVEQEILYENNCLGTVVLCCPADFANAGKYLHLIISGITGELIHLEDESALLAELGMSWESLQAIYDLNADLNSFHNPQKLLEKITERVEAVGNETCAVLWLRDEENLKPAASTNNRDLAPRAKDYGIIGEVFTKQRLVVCNNISGATGIAENETELKNAVHFAVFPVATRIKNYGVLEVWQEDRNSPVFDSRTTRLLDTLALQAAMVIETESLHRESIENEKLQQEIEIGSKIQQILLTGNPPDAIRGVKIAALTIPSRQIDGDFYDFIEHGENCFDLIIGDVMGKGIPAALVGAATKNCFFRAVGQLQSTERALRPAPEKIVGWVNNEMTAKLMQFESFVTSCYTRFDLEKRLVTFVDCGHTKTIFYNHRARKISALEGDNMPLGFSEREIFKEQIVSVETGDVLFFFSDGITETRSADGEFFGDERLAAYVFENAAQEPREIISGLLEMLQNFSGETNFGDDLTCVAVRIEENLRVDSEGKIRLAIDRDLRELERVRQFVRKACQLLSGKPATADFTELFELAVNETITNVIRHAHQNKAGDEIQLFAENSDEGLQITVGYNGENFDPKTAAAPVFDGSREGGFGLYIISNCVDRVVYTHDSNNQNTICLTKKK
ncbi:MAG TPA: SpoIIE family protein phosphatase [Pyrinomonadaceae bacterium]|jgi:sigma-B regulation protein RsbU (phosphoserine phosphatase)|nr:SpoIIE family protein phosphatase [Pyrinomonadaceae bacterium]